jgi:hypothetical protein
VTVGLKVPSRLLFLFAIWGAENLAQKLAIWGFPGVDFREVEKKSSFAGFCSGCFSGQKLQSSIYFPVFGAVPGSARVALSF